WIDEDNLAIYLLDVSGHGVGSALLSVSVQNVLRSQSLPNTNFCQPSEVLKALNQAFQMTKHGDKYFTIWYGVYHRLKRQLIYANAGHPPALLFSNTSTTSIQVKQLSSLDLPIGFLTNVQFEDAISEIEENSTLYIFSDGAYEINQSNGKIWGIDAFIDLLTKHSLKDTCHLKQLLADILNLNAQDNLDDDLSLVKVNFS
ncbi:MAG: PP2C family protein-serine/threonine phosphatase, partial [Nostoc sp. C3-bin3]|nr:PP2C family protein-serine/threonine phosphatase [Nostoc sp. C3-bin3]